VICNSTPGEPGERNKTMEKTKEYRTEAFKTFIQNKEMTLSDLVCLVDSTADKAGFLEEFFLFRDEECSITKEMGNGLAHILSDIHEDLRLISAELMSDVEKTVEERKKELESHGKNRRN
jgi:hypothetical protein